MVCLLCPLWAFALLTLVRVFRQSVSVYSAYYVLQAACFCLKISEFG